MAKAKDAKPEIAALTRVVALLADATAQYLDGTMDKATAAGHLHDLNAQAQAIMNRLTR